MGGQKREGNGFLTVIEHRGLHASKAADSLFHDSERRQSLGKQGIARTRSVPAFAELG